MEVIKKYWKYIIPIIIVLAVLLFFVLFFSIPRLEYKYNKEYEVYEVNKCYGDASEYKIKGTSKNTDVGLVGERAFFRKNVKRINIESPEKIETIEKLAFSECDNLEYINISYVKYFERNSFSYCDSLKISELNAIDIGASTFYGCESITDIKFNEGLKSIGSYAFSKTSIEVINLPNGVEEIYNDAFADMYSLKEINVYRSSLSDESIEYLDSISNVEINYL